MAPPVCDQAGRRSCNVELTREVATRVVNARVRDPEFARVPRRVGAIVAYVDTDEDDPAKGEADRQCIQLGLLLAAGPAPRRPEVDHDRTDVLRQGVPPAVNGGSDERRQLRQRWVEIAVAYVWLKIAGADDDC
jgi:hypothetical protein